MPEQPENRKAIAQWILDQTPQGGRVLDIGCGDGELLSLLVRERQVHGTGIELSEECVIRAVEKGLSVHHGDVEEGLDDYGDKTFDLVLLSLTIQELADPRRVLREAFRVGKRVLITFPNFGYWKARWQLAVRGRAPITPNLPYRWYEGPNRHFLTAVDFEDFCREEEYRILDKSFITKGKRVRFLPNLRAEVGLYLLDDGTSASA